MIWTDFPLYPARFSGKQAKNMIAFYREFGFNRGLTQKENRLNKSLKPKRNV